MAKLLKLRRGTTTQHASFTGAEGELTVDITKDTAVVHDGSTQAGRPLAREDMSNVSSANIAGQLGTDSIATTKIAAGALPTDVTVASANIVDGSIVNADVNTSAAIAGTKIAPDFGSQDITTTGKIKFANVYATTGNLPSASTYHGMFAHVHDTGAAYFAHNGSWWRLVNRDSSGGVDIPGNLDVGAGIDVTGDITATGNLSITSAAPQIFLTDSNANSDYAIVVNTGQFRIRDETNGANRLAVNSNGNIDISESLGVSGNIDINGAPPWSVAGGNYANISLSGNDGSSSGFIYMGSGSATTNADFDLGRINFLNNTTITAQITGTTQTSANDDGRLAFHTKATGGSLTQRMALLPSGSLLVGTTTDLGKFTVSKVQNDLSSAGGFANPHIRLDAENTTNNTGFTGIAYSVSSLTNYGWTAGAQRVSTGGTDGAFIFRHHSNSATGNERFRMKSTGDVEIKSDTGNTFFTLTPTASASTSLIINTWQDNSNGRNWAIRNRYNQHGRLEFMRSTANNTAPFSTTMSLEGANVTIAGSLSKGSGSFKIDHPLSSKTNTHHLVHSFIEGPQADLIYRGKVDLVGGIATVNIDTVVGMSDGTFVLLNREVQCFTSNETGWTAVKGSVSGNVLTITAQDNSCTDTISWMVVGERKDPHMYDTEWTDTNGKVILEPLKETKEAA